MPWSLIPHGQLTQLRIIFSRGISTPSVPSLDDSNQLFDLLINIPDLEILSLEFCLPSMLSQVSHGEPIHLPRLSRLSLGGATSRVTNLLKKLKLPSSATLHLCGTSEDPSTYPILPLISAHFCLLPPLNRQSTTHGFLKIIEIANQSLLCHSTRCQGSVYGIFLGSSVVCWLSQTLNLSPYPLAMSFEARVGTSAFNTVKKSPRYKPMGMGHTIS